MRLVSSTLPTCDKSIFRSSLVDDLESKIISAALIQRRSLPPINDTNLDYNPNMAGFNDIVLGMSELNVVIAIFGFFVLTYGIISVKIKNAWYLGEACEQFDLHFLGY